MEFILTVENASIPLLALLAFLACLVSLQMIQRRGFKPVVRDLVFYLILAILWETASLLAVNGLIAPLFFSTAWWLPYMGSLLLATAFLIASSAFFEANLRSLPWILAGATTFLAALLLAIPDLLGPWAVLRVGSLLVIGPELRVGMIAMSRPVAILAILLLGWSLALGRTFYLILPAYRKASRPLHKNRVVLWAVSALIIFFGDLLLFGGISLGGLVRLAGGCAAGCALISNRLEGTVQRGLRVFNALMISLLATSLYGVAFLLALSVIQPSSGPGFAAAGLVQGGFLAFMVNPALLLVLRKMDRVIYGFRYDPAQTGRVYSRGISNIIELDRLADTALGQIGKIFRLRRGQLYLVEEEITSTKGFYLLRPAGHRSGQIGSANLGGAMYGGDTLGGEDFQIEPARMSADNPAATFFRQRQLPLTRYDLDGLPRYQNMPGEERKWLTELAAEVYVPICTERQWIGLFALGPKNGSERYHKEDLDLLKALAGRTSPVLENARRYLEHQNGNLDFGKDGKGPVSGKSRVKPSGPEEWFDFGRLACETVKPLMAMAEEKRVALKLDLDPDLPPLTGDRKTLAIAIYQLVHNAIKFNRPEGKVWVSCRGNSGDLTFDVKDTGAGISRSKLATLWAANPQNGGLPGRNQAGEGTGLAWVKKIITTHGGQVWADSWEGKGSVFGFTIPVEEIPGEPSPGNDRQQITAEHS